MPRKFAASSPASDIADRRYSSHTQCPDRLAALRIADIADDDGPPWLDYQGPSRANSFLCESLSPRRALLLHCVIC
jgi:hypothetical protein